MPSRTCPKCRAGAPRLLAVLSEISTVNYYRCDACGHVWTVSKDGRRLVSNVTIKHDPADPDSN
jgi:uncharacterized Zn finger protein